MREERNTEFTGRQRLLPGPPLRRRARHGEAFAGWTTVEVATTVVRQAKAVVVV